MRPLSLLPALALAGSACLHRAELKPIPEPLVYAPLVTEVMRTAADLKNATHLYPMGNSTKKGVDLVASGSSGSKQMDGYHVTVGGACSVGITDLTDDPSRINFDLAYNPGDEMTLSIVAGDGTSIECNRAGSVDCFFATPNGAETTVIPARFVTHVVAAAESICSH